MCLGTLTNKRNEHVSIIKNKSKMKSVFGERRLDGGNPSKHESLPLLQTLKAFWRILIPFWITKESLWAWLPVVGIAFFTVMTIYLAKQFNNWYKEFWDFIQQYNMDGFIAGIILFVFLATCHVVTVVYKAYVVSALTIRWRKWLTQHYVDRYLANGSYYCLQLTDNMTDNPDQRIAEDMQSFASLTISIIINIVTSIAMLITFAIVLWELSPAVDMNVFNTTIHLPSGYLFYLALGYATIGTIITFFIGKPLALLNFRQQRYEADYRFSLIRLRENAESVALYRGEDEENKTFRARFKDVVGNYIYLINRTKALNFFVFGCAQTAVIFPILVASPLYFAKVITIGSLMQINSAFGKVYDSLSTIMDIFPQLASWKAVVDRLALFESSLQNVNDLNKPTEVISDSILGVKELDVTKPDGTVLVKGLNLELTKGDSLLVKGESGLGKSTLLRAFARLWPYAKGNILFPKDSKVLFLSQKPYMPLGTIKEAIFYPSPVDEKVDVASLLDYVGLNYLKDKLDLIDNWSHVLSLGEQQRIAFLRVVVNKPDVLFMDEASSALDITNENKLYTLIQEQLKDVIIVSVGHRDTLDKFHNKKLFLKKDCVVEKQF